MDERARIRISLAAREIEIEGSEAFVERYRAQIEAMLERVVVEEASVGGEMDGAAVPAADGEVPRVDLGTFGAFLHHLPNAATEVDRMLAAGYFIEQQASDGTFTTAEANRRLAEHGIKIGNPSQCVRQSQMAKRVFTHTRGRYKVALEGRRYLSRLTGGVVPL